MAYIGQEYMAHTQLYHYNGRLGVYPELIGNPMSRRMLSPDKLVPKPENGQSDPNAFLSCLVFDEDLKLKDAQSLKEQVTIDNLWHTIQLPSFEANQNGYVYIFCSNGSDISVFFDDIEIEHKTGNIVEETHYYPFGQSFGKFTALPSYSDNKLLFTSQMYEDDEWANNDGLKWYDFDARNYDPQIARWHCVDQLSEQFVSHSPYQYSYNNPISFIDPDGRSSISLHGYNDVLELFVTKNDDGTYKVAGGEANSDKNIYIVDEKGNTTGEIVGEMLTEYSFHRENGSAVDGTNIDLTDQSGTKFFDGEIKNIDIVEYILNAKRKEPLDFKRIDQPDNLTNKAEEQYHYRGMYFNGKVASARDIGNYSAGYVAGKHGFSWEQSRFAFDALETEQVKGFWDTLLWYPLNRVSEGQPTQRAQKPGYEIGFQIYDFR